MQARKATLFMVPPRVMRSSVAHSDARIKEAGARSRGCGPRILFERRRGTGDNVHMEPR
jgi:hypothetical protein